MKESQAWLRVAEHVDKKRGEAYLCLAVYKVGAPDEVVDAMKGRIAEALGEPSYTVAAYSADDSARANRKARVTAALLFAAQAADEESAAR